jgi:hypothetical protein
MPTGTEIWFVPVRVWTLISRVCGKKLFLGVGWGASHFCKSTNLGFFKGNFLLKLGVLLSVLSLNPSFWGVLPPKPPVGGVAPPPNPPRISFSVGCLHAIVHIFVPISESLIIADCRYFCKCGMQPWGVGCRVWGVG